MACVSMLWKDVWPVIAGVFVVAVPMHGLSHWRFSVLLNRKMVQITATLDRKMKIKLEVDEANEVKITPVDPRADDTES